MPRMRTTSIVVSAAAALLFVVGCIHVRPASAFQKATSMEQYERAMWDAIKNQKWQEVESHMAETYVISMPDTVRDRAAMLEHLKQVKLSDYAIADLQSRPNGNDMVVTYTIEVHGTFAGKPLPFARMRILTVWQTVKRGWIEIAQSAQPIAD